MERLKPKYRNILVCYDEGKQIGWKTRRELEDLLEKGEVNWYKKGKEKRIDINKNIDENTVEENYDN